MDVRTEMEDWIASAKWGRVKLSWFADVVLPPQMTRFPLEVHLAADTHVWVALERARVVLMVAQMSAGVGLLLSGQGMPATSTTMLGRCGDDTFAAYVCGVRGPWRWVA